MEQARAMLERLLVENIVGFWYPRTIDDHGGFHANHDLAGRWLGPSSKFMVVQARTTWFFARLARSPYGGIQHLEAARHGYEFLRDVMWDERRGGFNWEVGCDGTPNEPIKQVYAQVFGLYTLAEYARSSGESAPLELAQELFELLETHAYDEVHGGYREFRAADWSEPSADVRSPSHGVGHQLRSRDLHVHVVEAMTALHGLLEDPRIEVRLREAITICSMTTHLRPDRAEWFTEEWAPVPGIRSGHVMYGLDLESLWLVLDGCTKVGMSHSLLLDHARSVFESAVRRSLDRRRGGFAASGLPGRTATSTRRTWWAQAEALVACSRLYEITNDERFMDVFRFTLGWIVDQQVDWQSGEWFEWVQPDGTKGGVKAGPWKGPYHNGRAMIECLAVLDRVTSGRAAQL